MPTWTPLVDWEAHQVVTAVQMNEQIKGNLEYLYDRPGNVYSNTVTASRSANSFAKIGSVEISITIPSGAKYLIGYSGYIAAGTIDTRFNTTVYLDGTTRLTRLDFTMSVPIVNAGYALGTVTYQNLAAGTRTLDVRWASDGLMTISSNNYLWTLWAIEVKD
jgi:hypothetical protein